MTEGFFPATAMPDHDWWSALWPDPEKVVCALGITPDMVVADLCCGDGYFTAAIAEAVRGKVYGLDLAPEMIAQTRSAIDRAGLSVLSLICADAHALPDRLPEKVDYVLMANTFHGVPDKTGLAHAVARALKPKGLFAIVNWHPIPREQTTALDEPRGPKTEMRMAPKDVQASVEPAGFRLENLVELPPYHYGAIFRKV